MREVIRGHQRSSEVIRGHQRSSALISALQKRERSSEIIRDHQRSSEVIGGHQRSSEVIRIHQRSSEVISGHQRSSEVIRIHQRSSGVIRGHQRQLTRLAWTRGSRSNSSTPLARSTRPHPADRASRVLCCTSRSAVAGAEDAPCRASSRASSRAPPSRATMPATALRMPGCSVKFSREGYVHQGDMPLGTRAMPG